jgi:hypothetical protein
MKDGSARTARGATSSSWERPATDDTSSDSSSSDSPTPQPKKKHNARGKKSEPKKVVKSKMLKKGGGRPSVPTTMATVTTSRKWAFIVVNKLGGIISRMKSTLACRYFGKIENELGVEFVDLYMDAAGLLNAANDFLTNGNNSRVLDDSNHTDLNAKVKACLNLLTRVDKALASLTK